MAGEETQNWNFHHIGVIVSDIPETVEYYKSLGFVDFPPPPAKPPEPTVWTEIVSYGETVIKDGKLLIEVPEGAKPGGVRFCAVGGITLELVQPGGIKDVNGDFINKLGSDGVDHIAYTVRAEHFDKEVEKMLGKGLDVLLSGKQANGGGFVYFDTRAKGGLITELMKVP